LSGRVVLYNAHDDKDGARLAVNHTIICSTYADLQRQRWTNSRDKYS